MEYRLHCNRNRTNFRIKITPTTRAMTFRRNGCFKRHVVRTRNTYPQIQHRGSSSNSNANLDSFCGGPAYYNRKTNPLYTSRYYSREWLWAWTKRMHCTRLARSLQHVFQDIVFHFYRGNWMDPTGLVKFRYSEFSSEIEIVRSVVCEEKNNIKMQY